MNNSINIIILFLLLHAGNLSAQSIELRFPHFAQQGWYFRVFQGEKMDTIAKGTLDDKGQATILLPEDYRNYRGMSQWLLTNGGGLDIIIGGNENVQVSCLAETPSGETIHYRNTSENDYLRQRFEKQQSLFSKIDAMCMAMESYKEDKEVSLFFDKQLAKEMQAYQALQAQTKESTLYAARFAEIVDLTRGYGKSLATDQERNSKELKDFIVHQMKFEDLYTSGHWTNVMSMWLESYAHTEGNEEEINQLLIKEYNTIFDRTGATNVKEAFAATTDFLLANNGKEALAQKLGVVGKTAFDFAVNDTTKLSAIGGKRLLFFYSSFCDLCQNELYALKQNYESLSKKGITVIGIDSEVSEKISQPWKYNIPDHKFEIFRQYKIEKSPAYIVLDEQGIVEGRYDKLSELVIEL